MTETGVNVYYAPDSRDSGRCRPRPVSNGEKLTSWITLAKVCVRSFLKIFRYKEQFMRMSDPLKFEHRVLSNGASAYMNLALPVNHVLLGIVFHAGSKHDPKGREGVAHFMEHMPFK